MEAMPDYAGGMKKVGEMVSPAYIELVLQGIV